MGHRPIVFEEGALIWYKVDNDTQIKKYVGNINEFLAREYSINNLTKTFIKSRHHI